MLIKYVIKSIRAALREARPSDQCDNDILYEDNLNMQSIT